ncbi:MAG: hypothetical protein HYU30_05695 [Chloroflexi bacterium]|nr:hypothetical protein [Chloroflexota bacterium]
MKTGGLPAVQQAAEEVQPGVSPDVVAPYAAVIRREGREENAGMRNGALVVFGLVGMLAILAVTGFLYWNKQKYLEATKAQVASLQLQVANLEGQLTASQSGAQALQTRLEKAVQDLALTQQQLVQSGMEVTALQGQISAANKRTEAVTTQLTMVKAELEALQAPPLTTGDPVVTKGSLSALQRISVPIELKAFEQVQGELFAASWDLTFYIQDPTGAMVRNFGKVVQTNFQFTAQAPGRYTLFIADPYGRVDIGDGAIAYTLRYVILRK